MHHRTPSRPGLDPVDARSDPYPSQCPQASPKAPLECRVGDKPPTGENPGPGGRLPTENRLEGPGWSQVVQAHLAHARPWAPSLLCNRKAVWGGDRKAIPQGN